MHIPEPYSEFTHFIFLFGLGSFFILWIAQAKGFFILPYEKNSRISMCLLPVAILFGFYLCVSLFLSPLLFSILYSLHAKWHPGIPFPALILYAIQLFAIGLILLFFFFFARFYDEMLFKKVIKNGNLPNAHCLSIDIGMGILTWFIAFPLVAMIGEIADMLVYFFFGLENYEQVAVRYLKTSLSSFESMIIPLFIILLAAPTIEEFLFRGCLQNYFKRRMGIKKAIILSSTCFALFHFSMSQGIGNVSLLASLFTFALFLGFIYERQASLFASIALHITFNAFSTIRILFFPE